MIESGHILGMYLHLARASSMRQQPLVRDKMLVLAGVKAEEMGLDSIAALCRQRILAHNPQHLVRQWPTLAAAVAEPDFQSYLKQLRRRYSPERIEHMLETLGIQLAREREAYFSDFEYAAALLDTTPDVIDELLEPAVMEFEEPVEEPEAPESPPRKREAVSQLSAVLIVWGPWLVGLVILAALAVVWRGH